MSLIQSITSQENLLSTRDHFQKTLKETLGKRLGKSFGQRDFDELIAKLLGAKDFNTAMGMVPAHKPASAVHDEHYTVSSEYNALCAVVTGLLAQNYLPNVELYGMLDELIFVHVGSTKEISDMVNNQGYQRQLLELQRVGALSSVYEPLADEADMTVNDLRACVQEATRNQVRFLDIRSFLLAE